MKNKILTVFLVVILISFCFIGNSAFASIVGNDGISYPDLPADYQENNFTICSDGNNTWLIIYDKSATSFYISGNKLTCGGSKMYGYYLSNNSWVSNFTSSGIDNGSSFTYYYSSVNIYTDNSCSSIFFHVTPVTVEEIMKQVGEQATQEVGQTILVAIVAIVGLIIFVIGLKKGLTALMNGLKN